jgi:hypothetical protein
MLKKQKGIEGLVLRGGSDISICGEVGEVVSNFLFPKLTRMLSPVILDAADDPTKVRFFQSVRYSPFVDNLRGRGLRREKSRQKMNCP